MSHGVTGASRGWAGIDCGYSQMTVALLDDAQNVLAVERTTEPTGDGHSRAVALERLRILLKRLGPPDPLPVRLAGYCYEASGVAEEFQAAGWNIERSMGLNDVVGFYGLTDMAGNAVVCGCGSYPQVIYVNAANDICWPGEDVVEELPSLPLCGRDYAAFLVDLSTSVPAGLEWLQQQVQSDRSWGRLGPLMERLLDRPELDEYVEKAVDAALTTREVLWRTSSNPLPPRFIFGGGAVSGDGVWKAFSEKARTRGVIVHRAQGIPAVGLARFAARHPGANPWAYLGRIRPSWL